MTSTSDEVKTESLSADIASLNADDGVFSQTQRQSSTLVTTFNFDVSRLAVKKPSDVTHQSLSPVCNSSPNTTPSPTYESAINPIDQLRQATSKSTQKQTETQNSQPPDVKKDTTLPGRFNTKYTRSRFYESAQQR